MLAVNKEDFCLKTQRLEIVPQSMDFLETTHAYASDKETMRYMLFLPNENIEDTKTFLQDAHNEWQKENPAFYECAILHGGKHIGGISIYIEEKDNAKIAELGWSLDKSAHGNGFAYEAATALVQWAAETLGIKYFVAHCDSENIPSWKTMEKLGMTRVSCTGGRFNKINPTEERKEFIYKTEVIK